MQPQSKLIFSHTLLASSLSLALFGQAALAEESVNELSKVEVTADKDKKITAKKLEQKQASTLQEAFRDQPEFNVGGGTLPVAQKLYARGLEDTMMNVSIDGAQQTGYLFHHQGRLGIETDIVKAVEADAGTGVATAGPGALAGAVNFETKDATDLLKPHENAGAIVKSTYSTNGKSFKNNGTAFGRLGDNSGVLVSGTKLDSSNYKDGENTTINNTAINQEDLFTKFSGNINEKNYASLSHENRVDEGYRNLRAHMIDFVGNEPRDGQTARATTTFNHKYTSGNPLLNTKTTVYHTNASMDFTNPTSFTRSGAGVETWGSDLRNHMDLDKLDITFGTDYRHDRGYVTGTSEGPDEDATVLGAYIQNDYRFAADWLLTSGARFDTYDYNDNDSNNYGSEGLSPNAGLTWFITDDVNLFVRHSRALRGVGLKEIYIMNSVNNVADIEPEKAHTTEFGSEYDNGQLNVKVQGFTQRLNNYIQAVRSGSSYNRYNAGNVDVWGYSADASYDWDHLTTRIGMNYSRPTLNGSPLESSAFGLGASTGRTWNTGIDYHLAAQRVDLGWTARGSERLTNVPASAEEKAGYLIHDISIGWKPVAGTDFDLKLAAYNIFNKQYWDQASMTAVRGLPEAGRDFRFTAAYRF